MWRDVAIIGAGPAGLTAAYLLTQQGYSVTVIEKDPVYGGGISRTVEHEGFRFDIGGHRFFSKSREVVELWNEILPHDFIERPRMSRIYYEGKFYSYPLRAFEALWNLGVVRSTLRSEEHTSELQSLMRNSYAVFCFKKKKKRAR